MPGFRMELEGTPRARDTARPAKKALARVQLLRRMGKLEATPRNCPARAARAAPLEPSAPLGLARKNSREVSGVHIANVVAPAIFGERGILEPGTPSAATDAWSGGKRRLG